MKKQNLSSLNLKTSLLNLGLVFILGACTLAPKYQQPTVQSNIPLPQVSKQAELTAHEIGWNNYFADPRLKALIEIGLKNNYDIQKAMLNLKKADAEYGLSIYNLIPNYQFNGVSKSRTGSLATEEKSIIQQSYASGLGVTNFELDLYRKFDEGRAAAHGYKSTAFDKVNAKITVISKIAKKYFDVRIDEQLLENAKQTLAYQNELFTIQKLRFNAGVISELELLNHQNALDLAQSKFMDVQDNYTTTVNQLAILIGQPIPDTLPAGIPLAQQFSMKVFPQNIPSEVILYRPDIRSIEELLKQSNAEIGVARAAFLPQISLTGKINASSSSFDNLFKRGNMSWVAGPSVTIPLFDIFPNTINLRKSKIAKEEMALEYNNAIQAAFLEIITALNTYDKLSTQYSLSAKIMNNNQKTRDLTRLRFNQGIADRNEMLDAETNFISSQNDFLNTEQTKLYNQVDLYTSIGGGINEYNATPNNNKVPTSTKQKTKTNNKASTKNQKETTTNNKTTK